MDLTDAVFIMSNDITLRGAVRKPGTLYVFADGEYAQLRVRPDGVQCDRTGAYNGNLATLLGDMLAAEETIGVATAEPRVFTEMGKIGNFRFKAGFVAGYMREGRSYAYFNLGTLNPATPDP